MKPLPILLIATLVIAGCTRKVEASSLIQIPSEEPRRSEILQTINDQLPDPFEIRKVRNTDLVSISLSGESAEAALVAKKLNDSVLKLQTLLNDGDQKNPVIVWSKAEP